MTQGRRPGIFVTLAVLLLSAGMLLAGCQNQPGTQLTDVPDPSASLGPRGEVWVNPMSHGGATPQAKRFSGTRTFALNAAAGGTFTFDRYTVVFPPGAVAADAQVTINVPSTVIVQCDLDIYPSSLKNHFNAPVRLTIDLHNTNVTPANIAGLGIYLQEPGGWTRVGDQVDPLALTVSADLHHFSSYRAGW
jgi:hypothetical protein